LLRKGPLGKASGEEALVMRVAKFEKNLKSLLGVGRQRAGLARDNLPTIPTIHVNVHHAHLAVHILPLHYGAGGPQAGCYRRVTKNVNLDIRGVKGFIPNDARLHRVDKSRLAHGFTPRKRTREVIAINAPE